jgi:hypothetical protein
MLNIFLATILFSLSAYSLTVPPGTVLDSCKTSLGSKPVGKGPERVTLLKTGWRHIVKEKGGFDLLTNLFDTIEGGKRVLSTLREIGPAFERLIVDPGLALEIDAFAKYAVEMHLQNEDPWVVREKFSKWFGTEDVWRAVNLTESEFKDIWENGKGLESTYTQVYNSIADHHKDPEPDFLYELGHYTYSGAIGKKLGASTRSHESLLASVTKYPDVAIYAASAFSSPEKSLYIFKLKIPKIDLIYQSLTSDLLRYNTVFPIGGALPGKVWNFVDNFGKPQSHVVDKDVESFVFHKIERYELVDYSIVVIDPAHKPKQCTLADCF